MPFPTPHVINGPAFQRIVDGILVQTENATPVTVFSIPVALNKVAYVSVFGAAFNLPFTQGAAATAETLFARAAGNLLRLVAVRLTPLVTNLPAPQPSLDLVANITTQSIDVILTGKTIPLRWSLEITVLLSV